LGQSNQRTVFVGMERKTILLSKGTKRTLEGVARNDLHLELSKSSSGSSEMQSHRKSLMEELVPGVGAYQGQCSYMEDVYKLILWQDLKSAQKNGAMQCAQEETSKIAQKNAECKVSFFTVCDGHGGTEAAEYVCSHLFNLISSQSHFEKDPEEAIVVGFAETEKGWHNYAQKEQIDGTVGTTVTTAIVLGNILFVANVGDSEAVLCSNGKAQVLTKTHVPSNSEERERVEREGGVIISDRHGTYRLGHPVWNASYVNLGVTRAIGDLYFKDTEYVQNKKSGLIAVPDIVKRELTQQDQFLLLCSDGFWDVITPEEAVQGVLNIIHEDSNSICKVLLELSNIRNAIDNVTVMLIKFNMVNKEEPGSKT